MALMFIMGITSPVATAADPAYSLTPTTSLTDGQLVSVTASNLSAGVTYLIVECGPAAIAIEGHSRPDGDINPEDGCDAQSATTRFTGNGSSIHATFAAHVMLNAAVGPIDCRVEQCFLALFPLAGGAPLHLQNVSFSAQACAQAGSCLSGDRPGMAGRVQAAGAMATNAPATKATATVGSPVTLTTSAGLAGDLTGVGAITGEVTGSFAPMTPPISPAIGEGIVRLDLAAPGTDWGTNVPTSIVADVAVDGGAAQQFVLFNGATPFVYAGGLGTLSTGSHQVTVSVNAALSHPGGVAPAIEVHDVQLQVVAPSNPSYATVHYAPIIYGRSTSALHDTPLLEYGSTDGSGAGATSHYTMIFSHEDSGTAFVPFMESAVWGRTTDIESFFNVTVDGAGNPTGGSYLSGNTPDSYPDTQNAISEPTVPYTSGVWDGGSHGVLRDATGNNDFNQNGTTAFRFRPVPTAAPADGSPREAAMDSNPWTYRIAGDEVARWYTNFTTDPTLPEQGDARQYAYVQYTTSGTGVDRVAIDVQLDNGATWYANDFGSGYPTGGTGQQRTVIKLPTDWLNHQITAVRFRIFPTTASSSVTVTDLKVFGLDANWGFHQIGVPDASVVPGFLYSYQTSTPTQPPATQPPVTTPPTSTLATSGTAANPTVAQAVLAEPTYTG